MHLPLNFLSIFFLRLGLTTLLSSYNVLLLNQQGIISSCTQETILLQSSCFVDKDRHKGATTKLGQSPLSTESAKYVPNKGSGAPSSGSPRTSYVHGLLATERINCV